MWHSLDRHTHTLRLPIKGEGTTLIYLHQHSTLTRLFAPAYYHPFHKKLSKLEAMLGERNQLVNLFKELRDILNRYFILLIILIAAANTDSGKENKMIKLLLLTIVLYHFFAVIGIILHAYNGTLLPTITCAMLIVTVPASFFVLSFLSTTLAWITLVMQLGMLILVAYDYCVRKRINN